ncbi:hypothetical protein D3C73_654150 [compost metagenome]
MKRLSSFSVRERDTNSGSALEVDQLAKDSIAADRRPVLLLLRYAVTAFNDWASPSPAKIGKYLAVLGAADFDILAASFSVNPFEFVLD